MRPPLSIRTSARSRRGVALVMFAALVFVFLAIAGLAIDIGTANLTQQQMQVAVDPAALEGVRLRDYNVYQHYSDPRRRPKVSNLVRLVFDDDMHPTGGTQASGSVPGMTADDADELQLGAGPMLRVSGQGEGPLAPSGLIGQQSATPGGTVTPTWDDPILQGNLLPSGVVGNFDHGDMVSGTYLPGELHTEDPAYHRPDFVAGLMGTAGPREALGFLVRMRRTTGANALDDSPGKASRGPTIPFLWSLGSLMMQAPNDDWDPRRDGLTVRATAIAVARPALRASPAPVNLSSGTPVPIISENEDGSPMLGLHSIALSLEYWSSILPGSSWAPGLNSMTISSDGSLVVAGEVRGYIVSATTVASVGRTIIPDASAPIPIGTKPGFVAIYARIPAGPTGADRVIGYGFTDAGRNDLNTLVRFRPGIQGSDGSSTSQVRVWVAANGASAQIGLETPHLSPEVWVEVFAHNRTLAYGGDNNAPAHEVVYDHTKIRPGTLLAPALAR